jgi:hypothetical protein
VWALKERKIYIFAIVMTGIMGAVAGGGKKGLGFNE